MQISKYTFPGIISLQSHKRNKNPVRSLKEDENKKEEQGGKQSKINRLFSYPSRADISSTNWPAESPHSINYFEF